MAEMPSHLGASCNLKKKSLLIWQNKRKNAFFFNSEIKPEDISESQAKEQKKNTHISSKPRELQVKTAKEDAMMGEGKA